MRHAFDNMKEGGWIEYMDFELELRSDTRSLEGEYGKTGYGHPMKLNFHGLCNVSSRLGGFEMGKARSKRRCGTWS